VSTIFCQEDAEDERPALPPAEWKTNAHLLPSRSIQSRPRELVSIGISLAKLGKEITATAERIVQNHKPLRPDLVYQLMMTGSKVEHAIKDSDQAHHV